MERDVAGPQRTGVSEHWRSGLFWVLVAVVLGSALALGGNRPIGWLTLSAGVMALFLLTATGSRQSGALWQRTCPLALGILLVAGWAFLQTVSWLPSTWHHPVWRDLPSGTVSAEPDATLTGIVRFLGYAAIVWVAAWGVGCQRRAQRLIDVVAVFSIALALYGLGAWAADVNPIVGTPGYPGSVTASFVSRNSYAFYAGLGAMCCLAALVARLPTSSRSQEAGSRRALRDMIEMFFGRGLVFVLGFATVMSALFLTGSRAGVVSALCGLGVVAVISGHRLNRPIRRALLAGLVGMGAVSALAAPRFITRLLGEDPVDGLRLAVYRAVIEGIGERPFLGHGLGAFQTAFRPYVPSRAGSAEWDLAHNTYLENAFELGLPAAVVQLGILMAIMVRLWRALEGSGQSRPVIAVALGAITAGALHSLLDFSLQMPAAAALFSLLLGAAWGVAGHAKDRSGKHRYRERT
jgi:O-antigen ligase